jgi:hypothetical protein
MMRRLIFSVFVATACVVPSSASADTCRLARQSRATGKLVCVYTCPSDQEAAFTEDYYCAPTREVSDASTSRRRFEFQSPGAAASEAVSRTLDRQAQRRRLDAAAERDRAEAAAARARIERDRAEAAAANARIERDHTEAAGPRASITLEPVPPPPTPAADLQNVVNELSETVKLLRTAVLDLHERVQRLEQEIKK